MKLLHITIHTAVPEASAKFYCDVLGFAVQEKFTGAMGKSIQFLENPESDVRIELIDDEAQAYNGSGLSIGFHVDDVEKAHEQMQGLNPSAIVSPNPHTRFFFIKDPNGVQIQII